MPGLGWGGMWSEDCQNQGDCLAQVGGGYYATWVPCTSNHEGALELDCTEVWIMHIREQRGPTGLHADCLECRNKDRMMADRHLHTSEGVYIYSFFKPLSSVRREPRQKGMLKVTIVIMATSLDCLLCSRGAADVSQLNLRS